MNDFVRDNDWQKKMRDTILAPAFYGKYALGGRYVFIDKGRLATQLQREYAVDTIIQGRDGDAICLEEKIVRWPGAREGKPRNEPYTAFALEVMSCTIPGHEKTGWMFYGEADYLLYCFADRLETELDCYLIDFPALQEWFRPRMSRWPLTTTSQFNRSQCRVVDIADVRAAVKTWRKVLQSELYGHT